MGFALFRLITAALFPVAIAAALYLAEQKSRFGGLPRRIRQVIAGICFGIAAVLATEFGIRVDGAVLNVRGAAPLTAGLIFGWPAGLISGLIGGVHRWFTNAGDYTRLACSVGTFIAGLMGAALGRIMENDQRSRWFYGLAGGVTAEVLHMLMVFIFNTDDIYRAFGVVRTCAVPMITFNGLSVMMAIITVEAMRPKTQARARRKQRISQVFQRGLLVCVLMAFAVTLLFTGNFQNVLARANADRLLKQNIEDVRQDIVDAADAALLSLTHRIADVITEKHERSLLKTLVKQYDVAEIHLVDENGVNVASSHREFEGFDFASGEQSAEFLCLLEGETEFVQSYQPISSDASVSRKYAGVALESGGFVQVGYDLMRFQQEINQQVSMAAHNRHIGQSGSIIICDAAGTIISDLDGHEGEVISLPPEAEETEEGEFLSLHTEIYGVNSYCMMARSEGYSILAVLPEDEVMFSRDVAVYILAFMEVLVFASLFALIFVMIRKMVVNNILKINASLSQIAKGNLDVTVDVRDNAEFESLSDDINSTVSTLRHYIQEAEARFDKDLEIARIIQQSSLPSVFPPYPNRPEFDIYAGMTPAREVGGDFYDFYLLDEKHLAFLVADVSGKGIPAAMFMMTAKTLIKSHAESGLAVNDVFGRVNARLCENNEAGMFVTAWMGILDLESGCIRYANAGHNPPAVRRANGEWEFLSGRANLVLGGMDCVRYREQQYQLQPGDEICLYTDGVTEAHNGEKELFGNDRLICSLNTARGSSVEEICRRIKADVDAFAGEAEQFDDITILCIRMNETGEQRMLNFEPVMESLPTVMEFVEARLEEMEVSPRLTAKMMIAVDEICSNIIRHSGASAAGIGVEKAGGAVQLVFSDDGKPYNPLNAEEPDLTASAQDRAVGGLGVFMVRKMMDHVEYMHRDGRNILKLQKNVD